MRHAQFKWHADFAVRQEIVQLGGAEAFVFSVEDTFGTAGQPFVQAGIAGALELNVVIGADAIVPGTAVVKAEGLAIDTVGFFAVVALYKRIGVGVLSVTGVQVALTAIGILKLQRLQVREVPVQQGVDIFIYHSFATGRGAIGIGCVRGTVRFM